MFGGFLIFSSAVLIITRVRTTYERLHPNVSNEIDRRSQRKKEDERKREREKKQHFVCVLSIKCYQTTAWQIIDGEKPIGK